MAHFAELDENNKVLRVVVACNQDIANNGGEQSEQAANHFATVCPLSINGVKWVQTSYNHNFRGHFAGVRETFNSELNLFLQEKPYPSWTLNTTKGVWEPPVERPEGPNSYFVWDENIKQWKLNPELDLTEESILNLKNT